MAPFGPQRHWKNKYSYNIQYLYVYTYIAPTREYYLMTLLLVGNAICVVFASFEFSQRCV